MRRVLCATILSLMMAPAASSAFELGVKGAYWMPDFSGQVQLDSGGIEGTHVDVSDDLGIDDEDFVFGEAWIRVGRHRLVFAGMRVEYSGRETVAEEFVFAGNRFVADGTVKSSLEYTMLDLAYQFDLLDLENLLGGFSLGPIIQVKYLDGELKISGEGEAGGITGRASESQSFQFPFPMVGLGAYVGILVDVVELRARGAGLAYQGDYLIDIQGEVSFTPVPFFELVGGYRHIDIDVDQDDVLLDYTQTGPYVGASVKI